MSQFHFPLISIALASFCALRPAHAFPPLDEVPDFGVRVQVVQIDGKRAAADEPFLISIAREKAIAFHGSAWSPWVEPTRDTIKKSLETYPNSYNRRWQVKIGCSIRPSGKQFSVLKLNVETRIKNGETSRMPAELQGSSLGIILWRDVGWVSDPTGSKLGGVDRVRDLTYLSDAKTALHIDTLAGHGRRVYDDAMREAVLPKVDRPQQILFGGRYIGGDNDAICWREGIRRLSGLGFNAMHGVPKAFIPVVREGGISRLWGAVYNPPGYAFNFASDRDEIFRDFAAGQIEKALTNGWKREEIAFWVTSDEPGWYYPATYRQFSDNPVAIADFKKYLQQRGLRPNDLGLSDWSELRFIGRREYTDLPSRRLFYWSNRFIPWASSRFFSEVAQAYEAELGEGVPVMVNFNNFLGRFYQPGPVGNNKDKLDPNSAMGQHDWMEFGRLRGSTCIATEDWFGDVSAPQWSFYATRLRSASELSGVGFGALVIPRVSGQRPEGMAQKLLALVGHGAKTIKFFTFGPEYNFPGNCYSYNRDVYKPLSLGMGIVGKAEELLYPGKMRKPQVAILMPQSSQLWDLEDQQVASGLMDVTNTHMFHRHMAYMSETCGLHLALQHAAIPVQAIDEESCTGDELKNFRVIYITAPDLPQESAQGLVSWVRDGGTLVMTAGSGIADRYHQPITTLVEAAGVEPRNAVRPLLNTLSSVAKGPLVKVGDDEVQSYGEHESLVVRDAGIQATFDDRTPAVTHRKVGGGMIYRFANHPGLSYRRSATEQTGGLPSGFADVWRNLIVEPVRAANVSLAVSIDRPLIEAPALHSERGVAVTLLNWSGKSQAGVHVTLRTDRRPVRVVSARRGKLPIEANAISEKESDLVFVTRVRVDLADVDVLSFYYDQ